ncbi:MAG: proline--tRNA ligase [Candidatus Aenigmatarchaeota archaeon]|nr:MAG: proline--tRNA ligase [Candidatus Aenigmarchaeota archaeon]
MQEGLSHPKSQFSSWFLEVVSRAGLADLRYGVKGFIVHLPPAVQAMKAMYRLYEQELERRGHKPYWFPAVIPESCFQLEKEHVEGFAPEVFWITQHGDQEELGEKLALRPTSETGIYRMFSLWIRSWKDLPLKLYQSCQVWRHETKATKPFIRGREFWWIEAHDAFATREEAEKQVLEDMEMTERVMHQEFGIPFIFFKRPEWDKFAGAVHTYAADSLMPDGRIIQQPSTHLLGQNFSKPFQILYTDEKGEKKHVWQTCYGPCIWRMLASVIAIHGDDKGLVFPFKIAPVQVVIIPVSQDTAVIKKCKEIYEKVRERFRAELDLTDRTPGWKFNEWELRGAAIRIEIGPKELQTKTLTLCRRDTGSRLCVQEYELLEEIEKLGEELTQNLIKRADEWFSSQVQDAKTLDEVRKKAGKGFLRVPWCSIDEKGRECAERLKEQFALHVRGVRVDKQEKPEGKCIICGKPAGCIVYIGRQY